MLIRVKICGVATDAGLDAAVAGGADAVGFVHSPSPRRVSLEEARRLSAKLPRGILSAAVFRRADSREIESALREYRPDLVQTEPPEQGAGWPGGRYCRLPVIRDGPRVAMEAARIQGAGPILFEAAEDGPGGLPAAWSRAAGIATGVRLVLAGGLHAGNVRQAILLVRPFGVDVSRGVESVPGRKDPERIRRFMEAVREAEGRLGAIDFQFEPAPGGDPVPPPAREEG